MQHQNKISTRQWVFLAIVCVTGAVLWSLAQGKDLNWDSKNYHFYVAYQWSENRLSKDFLAASLQSYFNPIAYLPFYWMVRAQTHSLLIGGALAAVHSINLLLVAAIADSLVPRSVKWRFVWLFLSVVLAALNPVFTTELGNTFVDVITSIAVLAGYAVSIKWLMHDRKESEGEKRISNGDIRSWSFAGLLLGMACGLKLTNTLFAIALLPLVLGRMCSVRRFAIRTGSYAAAGLIGFAVTGGYWAWRLFSEFRNPVFPLANAFFKSPDFPAVDLVDTRFIPDSIAEALLFPMQAMVPDENIYTEWCAPDGRFSMLFILAAGLIIKASYAKYFKAKELTSAFQVNTQSIVLGSWFLGYSLWLYSSGNGRYFLAGSLLLGPIIVALLLRVFSAHRFTLYGLVILIALQFGFVASAQHRWTPTSWTDHWFEVRIPDKLVSKPYLYLTPTVQTSTYLVPFLNRESAFSNIGGQVAIDPNGPGGKRVESMIDRYEGNVRSLFEIRILMKETDSFDEMAKSFDAVYERFGLETDVKSCEVIKMMDYGYSMVSFGNVNRQPSRSDRVSFRPGALSCKLVPHTGSTVLGSALGQRIDRVFNRIESACPKRFSPSGTVTKKFPNAWARTYFNSVATLLYIEDYDKLEYQVLGGGTVRLGHLADWEKESLPPFDCSMKKGHLLR